MYRVRDVMSTQLVTLKESDDLGLVEAILVRPHLRHLPVEREGKLVGLVTHRDLLRAQAEGGPRTRKAAEFMTRDVMTVPPDMAVGVAARLLLHNKFGCAPVVDATGRLVGIVTEADFVRFAARMAALDESISAPAGHQ